MRRVVLFIFPLILITVVFLISIFIVSKDSGKGALQITSTPSSKVYLNGQYLGDTPICRCKLGEMIKSGEYSVKLIPKEGKFDSFEERIRISPSVLTVVNRTFGKGGEGFGSIISLSQLDDEKLSPILITSFPNKADVSIDGKKEGKTPLLIENITASDHEIIVAKDSYKAKTLRVRAVPGHRLEIIIYLGIGESVSESTPEDTTIKIQKVVILDTPTGFLRVREASSSGSPQVGEVAPGEEYDLLEETQSWYKIKLKDGKEGWISKTYAELRPQ